MPLSYSSSKNPVAVNYNHFSSQSIAYPNIAVPPSQTPAPTVISNVVTHESTLPDHSALLSSQRVIVASNKCKCGKSGNAQCRTRSCKACCARDGAAACGVPKHRENAITIVSMETAANHSATQGAPIPTPATTVSTFANVTQDIPAGPNPLTTGTSEGPSHPGLSLPREVVETAIQATLASTEKHMVPVRLSRLLQPKYFRLIILREVCYPSKAIFRC
jgi:hypothetical protein